jgi:hypothetical protein
MKFRDTRFWKNYTQYNKIVNESSMRCTVDALAYWKLLTSARFNNFLEIGVYQGLTIGLFFESNPNAVVVGVDPVNRLQLFYKNYPEFEGQFTFINQPSQAVSFPATHYDFILIDGNHSSDSVQQDLIKRMPMLGMHSVLAIDDYQLPGVAKAINNLYNTTSDWIPFLQAEQTQFWHHRTCNREQFIDSLFIDPISKFIFIENVVDQAGNVVCSMRTLPIFTDIIKYFDLALTHYDI